MDNKKTSGPSKVYFCPVITPDNLIKVYEALGPGVWEFDSKIICK